MSGLRGALPGEYLELATPLHRMPALVKVVAVLALVGATSVSRHFSFLLLAAVVSFIVALVARMPARQFRGIALAILFFAAVTLVATLLLGGADGAGLPRSAGAVEARLFDSLRAVLRAVTALLLLGMFALSTAPERIVDELALLAPRRRGRPRMGGWLLALLVAFRLVPLLAEEFVRLRRARTARGARFEEGSHAERLRDLRDLYAAYLGALLRRVDEMSLALETRGYRS